MSPAERIKTDAEELRSPEDSGGMGASNDFVEVPAAVVCALCGDPDCIGCAEERSRSGVIAIVAWERPGPALARLWATAKSSSVSAEAFFEALPDGPIMPALRFAFFAELVASASMLGMLAGIAFGLLALLGVLPDGASLAIALRVALVAVFGLTTLLVAAHATHGLSLDKGARRVSNGDPKWTRALRFGLYAAGWDLVLGPVGFVVLLFREGPKAAFGIMRVARRLPTRSSLAFLRGTYGIDAEHAKPALQTSYVGAALATVVCALVIIAAVIAALIH
ncbi:MAG TPA: hypothetical protein VGH87_00365 [Polyangiaceae bacterium]|jgi:hypothetical protein